MGIFVHFGKISKISYEKCYNPYNNEIIDLHTMKIYHSTRKNLILSPFLP